MNTNDPYAKLMEHLKYPESDRMRAILEYVMTVDQAVKQPQVAARGLVVDLDDPVFGPMQVVNSAFKYQHADVGVREPAPRLGEHNETVLASLLGYRTDQIQALKDRGVLNESDA